jgi:hypothetical protein
MEGGQSKDAYPFKKQPGEEIARGWSESRVFKHDPGWILKVTYRGWRNTQKQLAENKSDYEFFKERLGDNVPETQFVRGTDKKGRPVNIVRQREIFGKTLADYPQELFEKNPDAKKNLVELFGKLIKMWDEDGRIPDLVGPKNPQRSFLGKFLFGAYPWNTPNIIVEDGTNEVFLVDTSASKRFQSKKAPFIYRKLNESIVKNMKAYINKYEGKTRASS